MLSRNNEKRYRMNEKPSGNNETLSGINEVLSRINEEPFRNDVKLSLLDGLDELGFLRFFQPYFKHIGTMDRRVNMKGSVQ